MWIYHSKFSVTLNTILKPSLLVVQRYAHVIFPNCCCQHNMSSYFWPQIHLTKCINSKIKLFSVIDTQALSFTDMFYSSFILLDPSGESEVLPMVIYATWHLGKVTWITNSTCLHVHLFCIIGFHWITLVFTQFTWTSVQILLLFRASSFFSAVSIHPLKLVNICYIDML